MIPTFARGNRNFGGKRLGWFGSALDVLNGENNIDVGWKWEGLGSESTLGDKELYLGCI